MQDLKRGEGEESGTEMGDFTVSHGCALAGIKSLSNQGSDYY